MVSADILRRLAALRLSRHAYAEVLAIVAEVAGERAGKSDRTDKRLVYVAGIAWGQTVKIGFSRNPWARIKELSTGTHQDLQVLATFKANAAASESELHELLKEHKVRREWFDLPDHIISAVRSAAGDALDYEQLLSLLRSPTTKELRSSTTVVVGSHPDKERSPEPSKEINPSSSSLRSEEPQKARERASRIPDGFEPDLGAAQALGLTFDQAANEAENFKDYWRSKATNATKRDWPATWRVWCRKAANQPNGAGRNGQRSATSAGGKPRPHDTIFRALAEVATARSGRGERPAGDDGGLFDHGGGEPQDPRREERASAFPRR